MNNIDDNFTLNEALSKKIQESLPFIIESLQKTEFQYTGKALTHFIPKSGYLINSILFSCKSGDPYSASILFRSLVEHSFRHLYIFVKSLNDKDDAVGKAYYNSLKANEDLESLEKIINYKKIVYPEDTQWNTKGDHNNAIREIAKSFRIEKIFYYLISNNNNEKSEVIKRYKKEYLLERLIEYTNMSSSVHGGPFGELALYELQKDKSKLKATLNKFANESFLLHKSIIETTYLFSSLMDEKVNKYYEEITKIR
jgi:hypothetical protein